MLLRIAGINPCKQYDVCANVLNAFNGSCVPAPTSWSCSCYFGYTWNSVVRLCVDENGCLGAPYDNLEHVIPGSCSDVQAPGVGFNCMCEPGFKWDAATTACVGE
jgi:hypothetical protein